MLEPAYCDRCDNTGWVICHCGGDLCVCENHGEMDCPRCGDRGVHDEYDDYGPIETPSETEL